MKKVVTSVALLLVMSLCLVIGYIEFEHRYNFGHFVGYGLHVDVVSRYAYIGIPGQSHMYNARISNFTLLPVPLIGCDFVTDAMGHGTEYPYAVQRWDPGSNNWQTIVEVSKATFCHPVPLSRSQTTTSEKWLWPGMAEDASDGEATGAREPFQKGDIGRFVVFRELGTDNDWQYAIFSEPFSLEDQVVRDDTSFKVEH